MNPPAGRSHRGCYLKGYRAFQAGEPRSACPYSENDFANGSGSKMNVTGSRGFWRAWCRGWDDAQKESEAA